MNNNQSTTGINPNQKTASRSRSTGQKPQGTGPKRGTFNRAYQAPGYFVITGKENSRVEISDKEFSLLNSWLELKSEESRVDDQKNALKKTVIDIVNEFGGGVKFRGFTFETKVRRTFEYSAEVVDLEKQLEALKAKERKNQTVGILVETPYVEVRAIEK